MNLPFFPLMVDGGPRWNYTRLMPNLRHSYHPIGDRTMAKRGGGNKTRTGYRDAGTGEFISENSAKRRKPENVIRESIPMPGRGDTGRGKKK